MAPGMAILKRAEPQIVSLDVSLSFVADLLLCIAQWMDAGYQEPQYLADLLGRFSHRDRTSFSILDYLRFRMTEAFYAMAVETPDIAIDILRTVLETFEALGDSPAQELAALANFWKGRAHRQKGDYERDVAL